MAASVQCRPQERTLGMVMKEVDDDLSMFLEMRNHENGCDDLLHTQMFDDSSDDAPVGNYLKADHAKSDYDWLLSPPDTPLCPSLEVERPKSSEGQTKIPNTQPDVLKPKASKVANSPEEPALPNNRSIGPPVSAIWNGRPSSSEGKRSNVSRAATPTGRSSLPATSKHARPSTPTSRATLPSTKTVAPPVRSLTPTSRNTTKVVAPPGRSSTPTRATSRASAPTVRSSVAPPVRSSSTSRATARPSPSTMRSSVAPPVRSSTPGRGTERSATPTGRPSSKSGSRSATPTRKFNNSTPSTASGQSSSGTNTGSTISKNQLQPRGLSPTVKSRPVKSSEMPDLSVNAPRVQASMTKRPSSTSRGRPSVSAAKSSSISTSSDGKPKQQAFPSTGRASKGSICNNGSSGLYRSRGHIIDGDEVNPVIIGTQMVERVVNMRKLAPPKQGEHLSYERSSRKPSLSQQNPGFGRSLSKKSLDMALRHMDITRSFAGDLHPLITSRSASSVNAQSSSTNGKTTSLTDSPLATSSNASSEPSVNCNSHGLNGREEDYTHMSSDGGHSTPTSYQQDS